MKVRRRRPRACAVRELSEIALPAVLAVRKKMRVKRSLCLTPQRRVRTAIVLPMPVAASTKRSRSSSVRHRRHQLFLPRAPVGVGELQTSEGGIADAAPLVALALRLEVGQRQAGEEALAFLDGDL